MRPGVARELGAQLLDLGSQVLGIGVAGSLDVAAHRSPRRRGTWSLPTGALGAYLDLKHKQVFTDQEYWSTLRPDVELLRTGIPSADPKFGNSKFWGPAKQGNVALPGGYKMKWHQAGPGQVQLRLPVMAGARAAFLCEAYVKDNQATERRKIARFKTHMNLIVQGRFVYLRTTPDQILKLASIMVEMERSGLDRDFIVEASELARSDQGVYDLMDLWVEAENDAAERAEIVADIQESLDDYRDAPPTPQKKPYIKYDQLDDIAQRVMAEKAALRRIIDKHGGVSAVAQKCGIPQPSLSRMLNSPSVPRRSTLYKIANALDLSEKDIALEWTR